jgi:hypothetical protein
MSSAFGHLIIMSPHVDRAWKTRFTRRTIRLGIAFFAVAFLVVAVLSYTRPMPINEADRQRLEAENNSLRVENKNIEVRIDRLSSTLDRLESMSQQVETSLDND